MAVITVNGKQESLDLPREMPILWALRDHLGLTGTKFGCGISMCGACTVHLDGEPIRSCVTPISSVENKKLTTIEAVGQERIAKALQDAWLELGVPQCGYCQPGQIMSASALLKKTPRPNDKQIAEAMNGNLCRCGTYTRIHAAIKHVAIHGSKPSQPVNKARTATVTATSGTAQ